MTENNQNDYKDDAFYDEDEDYSVAISPVEELEERVSALEERLEESDKGSGDRLIATWSLGMAIAVVLSWSRSASILWCILHGFFSWGYVIYFAVTR